MPSLRLKKGSECTLHYKTVSAKITLDRASQQSFYIDTKAMKVVHLEKKKDGRSTATTRTTQATWKS